MVQQEGEVTQVVTQGRRAIIVTIEPHDGKASILVRFPYGGRAPHEGDTVELLYARVQLFRLHPNNWIISWSRTGSQIPAVHNTHFEAPRIPSFIIG